MDRMLGRIIFGKPTVVRPVPPGPWAGSYRLAMHRLERPGSVLEGWSSHPLDTAPRVIVLYFGGRNENVAWVPHMASHAPGCTFYVFNYRGFGGSTGLPSEARVREDALAIWDFVAQRERTDGLRRVIVGRSLGTVVALELAGIRMAEGLVLMSPFECLKEVARRQTFGPLIEMLPGQPFDSRPLAARFAGRALVLMAEHDDLITRNDSLRLSARLACIREVRTIAGTNHRSLPRSLAAQQCMAAFFATI